jgi:hypothetical protein
MLVICVHLQISSFFIIIKLCLQSVECVFKGGQSKEEGIKSTAHTKGDRAGAIGARDRMDAAARPKRSTELGRR